jgi:hypothetical protein
MKVLKNNQNFSPISGDVKIINQYPQGIYDVYQNPMTLAFSLDKREYDEFVLPEKIYGVSNEIVDKVVNKYNSLSSRNLGVLFAGCKGTGKSLAAKKICNELGLPVVIIRDVPDDGDLVTFLANINQPYIVFIDEFEKVITKDEQIGFLSLLDGTNTSNILFLLTANEDEKILSQYKNRPSRIHYKVDFKSLTLDEIREVLNDKLKDKSCIEDIIKVCSIIGAVNYDIITSIIEEVNEFGFTTVKDIMAFMNVEPESDNFKFEARFDDGTMIDGISNKNPLVSSQWIEEYIHKIGDFEPIKDKDDNKVWFDKLLDPSRYQSVKYLDNGYSIIQDDIKFVFTRFKQEFMIW